MATRKPPRRRAVPEGSAPEPVDDSLAALREAAQGCKRCPLWKPATQTVFGEGPARARILVVGVFGTTFRLMRQRGTWQPLPGARIGFATLHPSAVLRQRGSPARDAAYRDFVADLALLLDPPTEAASPR